MAPAAPPPVIAPPPVPEKPSLRTRLRERLQGINGG
jgi:hypothetical protein